MTVRPILRYPDAGLRQVCAPVTRFDSALAQLADDLIDTMRAAPGIGITAAHVGIFVRLMVIQLDEAAPVRVYVNPELLSSSPETMSHVEGSVSMPGATEDVVRPRAVTLRYADLQGNLHEEVAEELAAICIQHEIDQLDGIFWLQKLSKLKRDRVIKKWEKQRRLSE